MPRKKIGPEVRLAAAQGGLADRLAAELKNSHESGQPLIYEQVFPTGKARVTVIWDEWDRVPLQERSATILRAYEIAEGAEARNSIALASGLTVPEAHAAGMLPYQIITALRKGDPVTFEQARQAFLDEGASALENPQALQLRFATEEEAQAARQRLIHNFPGSDDVWIINREFTAQDLGRLLDEAAVGEE
jgi:hypothetical protein